MSKSGVLVVLLWAIACSSARAAGSDYAEAMRVRRLIRVTEPRALPPGAEVLSLPVSRGFDQTGTSLCWSYATLNGLETRLRVAASACAAGACTVELSRRAMQYLTIRDRWRLAIQGAASYTGERGVAVDAMRLIAEGGLVAFADHTDVTDAYGSFDIAQAVDAAPDLDAKYRALDGGLARVYGALPERTHFEATELTPAALAARVTQGLTWESYAVATDSVEGYRPHPDPDARPGVRSWFEPAAKLVERIHQALRAGEPVELTIGGHCVLIRGGAYDAAGHPLRYDIKDSYPDYFYAADPARIMRSLVEVTTRRP